jgi:hypothetical protein
MLYYNVKRMTAHHHHHHPQGHAHPPAPLAPSLLRLSASRRLSLAAVLVALVWAAVIWAIR